MASSFATTDDGKRVMLNANGTWKYIEGAKKPDNDLVYEDGIVKVSFQNGRIYEQKYSRSLQTEVKLSVTVVTNTKIISPKTHMIMDMKKVLISAVQCRLASL